MKPGTKVKTKGLPSTDNFIGVAPETGVICKPGKESLPLRPGWCIVKFDNDGRKLCVHEDLFSK